MKKVLLACLLAGSIVPVEAVAAGGLFPRCTAVLTDAGVGILPTPPYRVVCELDAGAGEHTLGLGWTVGALGAAKVEIRDGDGVEMFSTECSLYAPGLGTCHTRSAVPHEGGYAPLTVTGPFTHQRYERLALPVGGSVVFSVRPRMAHAICAGVSCVSVIAGEGAFGLYLDGGQDLGCFLFTCPEPEPSPSAEPTPTEAA